MIPLSIVGLDLSLTGTGVAEVYLSDDGPQIKVATYGSKGAIQDTLSQRQQRILLLATRIVNTVIDAKPAWVLIEAPAFNSKNGHFHDRSGLWWLVVHSLADRLPDTKIVEATPQAVKKFATGKGNASKDEVLIAMTRRYTEVEFKNNNESDALSLAAIGASYVGHPIVEVPKLHQEALKSIRWPEEA